MKIALDARDSIKALVQDKYQMPRKEHLVDTVAGHMDEPEKENSFTSLDLQYAYVQTPLGQKATIQCNIQNLGSSLTGVYRYTTEFYVLTTMPTDF